METEHEKREKRLVYLQNRNRMQESKLQNLRAQGESTLSEQADDGPASPESNDTAAPKGTGLAPLDPPGGKVGGEESEPTEAEEPSAADLYKDYAQDAQSHGSAPGVEDE